MKFPNYPRQQARVETADALKSFNVAAPQGFKESRTMPAEWVIMLHVEFMSVTPHRPPVFGSLPDLDIVTPTDFVIEVGLA